MSQAGHLRWMMLAHENVTRVESGSKRMKAVILAGGKGTRLGQVGQQIPKAMMDVGGRPIVWHIMKLYASHGVEEFVVCCGHLGHVIRNYFVNYLAERGELTIDLSTGETAVFRPPNEAWKVTLVDTGQSTMTGGRLRRVRHLVEDGVFSMTYGDGLTDANLRSEINFHTAHGKAATVLAVQSRSPFGIISVGDGGQITQFSEKPTEGVGRINGGYFVLEPSVFSHLRSDDTVWEDEPLRLLADRGELVGYMHDGFWQCMDTTRDADLLRDFWATGRAPWRR